jgi:hypothetical protein
MVMAATMHWSGCCSVAKPVLSSVVSKLADGAVVVHFTSCTHVVVLVYAPETADVPFAAQECAHGRAKQVLTCVACCALPACRNNVEVAAVLSLMAAVL